MVLSSSKRRLCWMLPAGVVKTMLWRTLHLLVMTTLAISLPLLGLLGSNPTFFTARSSSPVRAMTQGNDATAGRRQTASSVSSSTRSSRLGNTFVSSRSASVVRFTWDVISLSVTTKSQYGSTVDMASMSNMSLRFHGW